MKPHYYNEFDPYAAQWLRNLISAGHLPAGDVDERSIVDVASDDLGGYSQCHFFAGIGGWPLAARLAGWPSERPLWTGSCPCQPFSHTGQGGGFDDSRHLWPAFSRLIAKCRPASLAGEQVASKDADEWFDLVHADLEALGYAVGAVPFPSASIGAPHIRDRIFWVANRGVADCESVRWAQERADASGSIVGDRAQGRPARSINGGGNRSAAPVAGFWANADWLLFRDGAWRPVEPGTFPLGHGIPARVGRLRAYGNAINPHQAAEVLAVLAECSP